MDNIDGNDNKPTIKMLSPYCTIAGGKQGALLIRREKDHHRLTTDEIESVVGQQTIPWSSKEVWFEHNV